ncbi:hypothetical protein [Helicobacter mustelae]|nr:hypothetical protein [Helicobacter mustelae]
MLQILEFGRKLRAGFLWNFFGVWWIFGIWPEGRRIELLND